MNARLFATACGKLELARMRYVSVPRESDKLSPEAQRQGDRLNEQLRYIIALLDQETSYELSEAVEPLLRSRFPCPLPTSAETVFVYVCVVCEAVYAHRRHAGSPLLCNACVTCHCKRCRIECTPSVIGMCVTCNEEIFWNDKI